MSGARPDDIGILAIEVYFPVFKVDQVDLERHDGVAPGKYTVGLGQTSMAFARDNEDVVSMAMTVTSQLLLKYGIDPAAIGRLEVGTESSMDRSKSVKSHLMQLFDSCGNKSILGVDCINACYGATAALFNAVNWIESRSWDGRYALVVAADMAVYARGPAQPSGGCGAISMLIGPHAPLVMEPGVCASHMDHAYDFYKPSGLYPQVDGKLSLACYLQSLMACYSQLSTSQQSASASRMQSHASTRNTSLNSFDYCVMHAPFAKMVKKAFSTLAVAHCMQQRHELSLNVSNEDLKELSNQSTETLSPQSGTPASYNGSLKCERDITSAIESHLEQDPSVDAIAIAVQPMAMQASQADYQRMIGPGLLLSSLCGNMYTASLYACLASLVHAKGAKLEGSRIMAYSYGSGLAASIFALKADQGHANFTLNNIAEQLDLEQRLTERLRVAPEDFVAEMKRAETCYGASGWAPQAKADGLKPGTYYLKGISQTFQRFYQLVE